MSGIAGILTRGNQEANVTSRLRRYRDLLSYDAASWGMDFDSRQLSGVYVTPHEQNRDFEILKRGSLTFFKSGEIYLDADAVTGPAINSAHAQNGAGVLARVAAMYIEKGESSLYELNGGFRIGIWDEDTQKLLLMTDRLGHQKLYYAQGNDMLFFSSDVKVILANPEIDRTLDPAGVVCLLSIGHMLNDRTMHQSITLLPGGEILTYRAREGNVARKRYWVPRYRTQASSASFGEKRIELVRRLRQAVARRIQPSFLIGIPLSGGLDSRALLGVARTVCEERKIRTFTIGHHHAYDSVFGRQLAQEASVEHFRAQVGRDYLRRYLEEFVWRTDGMVNATRCWTLGLIDAMRGSCERIIIGHLAGLLNGYAMLMEPPTCRMPKSALAEAAAASYIKVFTPMELGALLTARCRGFSNYAYEEFRKSVINADADDVLDSVTLADLCQRQQRGVSFFFQVWDPASPVCAPFGDKDLMEFLLTVPLADRRKKRLYRSMICTTMPELARVGWNRTGLPMNASRARTLLAAQYTRWRHSRMGRCFGRPHDRTTFIHIDQWMRESGTREFVQQTLRRAEARLSTWVDIGQVRKLSEDHMRGDRNHGTKLVSLITLAVWLEQSSALVCERRLAEQLQ